MLKRNEVKVLLKCAQKWTHRQTERPTDRHLSLLKRLFVTKKQKHSNPHIISTKVLFQSKGFNENISTIPHLKLIYQSKYAYVVMHELGCLKSLHLSGFDKQR